MQCQTGTCWLNLFPHSLSWPPCSPPANMLCVPDRSVSHTPRMDIAVMKALVKREGLVRSAEQSSKQLDALHADGKPVDEPLKGMLLLPTDAHVAGDLALCPLAECQWLSCQSRSAFPFPSLPRLRLRT